MSSLIDPIDPAYWADGEKRSENNGFCLGHTGEPINWAALQESARNSASSTRAVGRSRAQGVDPAKIYGLSRKADERLLSAPAKYSPAIEGREAGRKSTDKRDALRRGGI